MHKNPIAILLTILALIIVIVFLYAIYKVYTQNATTQDAIVGDYVITDDGAENVALQSDGGASQQTSLPAQKSLTAQQVVSDVIAAAQRDTVHDASPTIFTKEDLATSTAPVTTTVALPQPTPSVTSPATGPGAWAAMIAAVGAVALSTVGYKMLYSRA